MHANKARAFRVIKMVRLISTPAAARSAASGVLMLADYAALDWNERHARVSEEEWLLPYEGRLSRALGKQLDGLPRDMPLLELGCGLSDLAASLYDDGWRNVTSVDISAVAVQRAEQRWGGPHRPGLTFARADARSLDCFRASEFGVVLDKGTLDACCCGEGFDYEGSLVLKAVERVLAPGGRWICLSLMGPSVVMPLLPRASWPYAHHERIAGGLHLYHARRHRRGHSQTRWYWHPTEGGWLTRTQAIVI